MCTRLISLSFYNIIFYNMYGISNYYIIVPTNRLSQSCMLNKQHYCIVSSDFAYVEIQAT